jgi:hypothetical protein
MRSLSGLMLLHSIRVTCEIGDAHFYIFIKCYSRYITLKSHIITESEEENGDQNDWGCEGGGYGTTI